MPKIDIDNAPTGHGAGYPEAFAAPCKSRRLGEDACDYPDIDMILPAGADRYYQRDGTPCSKTPRRP